MSIDEDVLYCSAAGVATITINRPEKYNALRGRTCDELIGALHRVGWDKSVGVIVLTGWGIRRSAPAAINLRMTVAMTAAA